ncbi:amino acid adenylation domain-containing protein [Streptomyces sp. NPDC006540]|uniref:amino acid adenylation domain-containing protein n=1 Tax=Streptomyces sp. NPDC006540 TaxID=3155353 RepID=UPI0033B75978
MTSQSVLSVPRLGEGIVEVRIVRLLKQPGDTVAKDEVVYEMEHDKAAVEIESPTAGTLETWLVAEGDTVAIGAPVARITPAPAAPAPAAGPGTDTTAGTGPAALPAAGASVHGVPGRPQPAGTRRIPPRTRAHARRLGIDEATLPSIPAAGTSLMPADLERHLAATTAPAAAHPTPPAPDAAPAATPVDAGQALKTAGPAGDRAGGGFADVEQSPRQRELNRALRASRETVVPAAVAGVVAEDVLERARRAHQGTGFATVFQAFAHLAAHTAAAAPALRSRRLDERRLRVHDHVDLGIACATDDGDLTTAVVRGADTLDAATFDERYAQAVEDALTGASRADSRVTLILSHLGGTGTTLAVPVVVPPAVATLFLGAVEDTGTTPVRRMVLAFDHTVLNGSDAAAYLDALHDAIRRAAGPAQLPDAPAAPPRPAPDRAQVTDRLTALASDILGHPVDAERPLGEQGLDSARALRLVRDIRTAFGTDLPATAVWRHPTLRALAAVLPAPAPAPAPDAASDPAPDAAQDAAPAPAPVAPAPVAPAPDAASEPAPASVSAPAAVVRARTDAAVEGPAGGDEVAVIGMAVRVPGADDVDAFWSLLAAGECRIDDVPPGRLAGAVPEGLRAALLEGTDLFDAAFFDMTPRQAASMDPQQRALLELSWHALEHAGLSPDTLAGTGVGVYAAACSYDYREQLVQHEAAADGYATTGTFPAFLANRVSHLYDFTGPSITLDTACSGALTALSLAEAAIRAGTCEIALAGAANLISNGFNARAYRTAGMLSPKGTSKVFDQGADGFVRGEGAGWVVLKSLRRAVADGDPVLAVVRAGAVNHGGRAASLTAPSPKAQSALIRGALQAAGLDAADLGFLEAHGTGTPLGDPIELDAVREVLAHDPQGMPRRAAGPGGRLWVGSAKANIGHLEGASGLAGLVKAVQVLRHELIPATPGFTRLNPHIALEDTPLAVAEHAVPWPAEPGRAPRRAAVSAFGFGGSNAHVVLEEAPPATRPAPAADRGAVPRVVPLSAATPTALARLAEGIARLAARDDAPPLDALAWTLQSGRRHFAHRALFSVTDLAQLAEQAHRFAADGHHPRPADPRLRDWLDGSDLTTADWAAQWPQGTPPRRVPLVPYPFERQSYWLPTPAPVPRPAALSAQPGTAPGEGPGTPRYTLDDGHPLTRHRVAGRTVLPGAAVIDALADGGPVALSRLRLLRPVPVPAGSTVHLTRRTTPADAGARLHLEHDGHICATAVPATAPAARLREADTAEGPGQDVDLDAVLARNSVEVGPVYRLLHEVRRTGARVTARITAPAATDPRTRRVAWLDAALQVSCALLDGEGPRVAAAADHIEWSGHIPPTAQLTVHRVGTGPTHAVLDLQATDPDGTPVLRVTGLRLHPAAPTPGHGPADEAVPDASGRAAAARETAPAAGEPADDAHAQAVADAVASLRVLVPEWDTPAPQPAPAPQSAAAPAPVPPDSGAPADSGVRLLAPQWMPEPPTAPDDGPGGPLLLVHDDTSTHLADLTDPTGAGAERCALSGGRLDTDTFTRALHSLDNRRPPHIALLVDGSSWSEDRTGALALRGWLETLLTVGQVLARGDSPARITLITTGLAAPASGAPQPGAALQGALLGALRTLPREAGHLTCAAVDLDTAPAPGDLAAALREPCADTVALTALRDGRRLRQVYTEQAPPPAAGQREGFVHGGSYVLFGGTGGIGAAVARHLAAHYGARLLLVGRSPAGEDTRALLADLTAAGGHARYRSADITRDDDVARVLADCQDAYGRLDGIVHSIGSVSAAPLHELTAHDLDEVLATKVSAVIGLARALRAHEHAPGTPPRSLVLFSSVAGLFGSTGGLNYAAANAFLGHYAAATDHAGLTVRAFDWGLWRDTGLARRYSAHVRREYPGLTAFDPERGVAALEAGMSGNRPQIVAVAGDPQPLRPLTAPPATPAAPAAPAPSAAADDAAHRLEDYAGGALAHRMSELGLTPALAADPATTVHSAAQSLAAVPEHRLLLAAVLDLLAGRHLAGRPVPRPAELARTRRALLADHPDLAGHLTLLDRALESYGPVLRGDVPATAVLFPGGDLGPVSAVYSGNQLFDPVNTAAAHALADAAAQVPDAARILEIGAGVGGTTAAALDALDARGVTRFEYVYTDLSPAFLQHGRRRFGDRITPRLLDIEKNPRTQQFAAHTFDLVVASNVLHATRDLSRTLAHIEELLAPGGRLLLVEMVAPAAVYTLTFGLTDGWWRYVDTDRRMPHGPLLDVARWRSLLTARGWSLTDTAHLRDAPGCVALLTCRPPAAGTDRTEEIAEGLRRIVRDLLGDPSATVPGYLPWQELGIDSLLNMELVQAVSRSHGPVPATALFEHRTVDDLARMLARRAAPDTPTPHEDSTRPGPRPLGGTPHDDTPLGDVPHGDTGREDAGNEDGAWDRTAGQLTALVAELTAQDAALLDADSDFPALGVDSLLHEELTQRLREMFPDRPIPATLIFEHPTPRALARHLAPAPTAPTAPPAPPGNVVPAASVTARADLPAAPLTTAPAVPSAPPAGTPAPAPGAPIAVVGLAGRYPGAQDLDAFWELLSSGRTPVREVPAERWDWRTARTAGGGYARFGCFLDDIDTFDPALFRITPRDAALMDPQERLFLEVAREAFEHAGYARPTLTGHHGGPRVGVFAGVTANSHLLAQRDARTAGADNPEYAVTAAASVANRVSHAFDLSGPSLSVDTMCSSSLTALHLACRALRDGEADLALAGGVNLYLHPDRFTGLCALGMPSRGDRTRSFGAGGDGFVPGEGAGAVVLKRLDRAEADGDTIHAVIRGTGLNHGGGTGGYTVPNPRAQAALIDATLKDAGLDPAGIGYLEAHGTGTELGDPVELRALALAFAETRPAREPLRIGSVKSNIGHTEAAAGIAGLTKAILQLRHHRFVPTLNAEQLNPKLDLDDAPLHIQRATEPWSGERPRRCAVSSFGAGGAGAHAVLEEYRMPPRPAATPSPVLVPLAAPDADRLRTVARRLADTVDAAGATLADIAHTLATGRDVGPHRAAVTAHDHAELRAALRALAEDTPHPALTTADHLGPDTAGHADDVEGDGGHSAARTWVTHGTYRAPAGPARRVPLPPTPFARIPCTVPGAGRPAAERPSHMPLTDTVRVPAARTVTARLGGASRWVRDHIVDEQMLLPGAFHPELVHEALIAADENPYRTEICDLAWPQPATGLPMTVTTHLEEPDTHGDRRFTTTVDGTVVAQGTTRPRPAPGATAPLRPHLVYRPADLDARLEGHDTGTDAFYQAFAAHHFTYGPLYRTVRRAAVHGEETTAELRLPPGEDTDGRHVLHPALLDGACQSAAYLLLTEAPGPRRLRPLTIGRLTVHQPATTGAYVHTRRVRRDDAAGVHVFDLCLIDPGSGEVLAEIDGFRVRVDTVAPSAATTARPEFAPAPPRPAPVPLAGYRLGWHTAPVGDDTRAGTDGPLWLIGDGSTTLAAHTRSRIPAVALLEPGPGLDEKQLEQTAARTGTPATVLIDLTHLTDPHHPGLGTTPLRLEQTAAAWEHFTTTALTPLFTLLRTLVRSRALDGARILLVTRTGTDGHLTPLVRALHSLMRTAAGETGRFTLRLVTLDAAWASANPQAAHTALLTETAADDGDWTRLGPAGLRRTAVLTRAPEPAPDTDTALLDPAGSYLITGGLGGLGRHIAAGILHRAPTARLVLIGRSEQPDGTALEALRRAAAGDDRIVYRRCDATDPRQVADLATHLADNRIRLHGVVHAAGVLRDQFLRGKTPEAVQAVCRSKILGALHLDAALADHPLDFFVLASSLASLVGNQGQSDYAFANGFLDQFAHQRARWAARGLRPGRTLTAGWPVLADAGTAPAPDTLRYLEQAYGLKPVATRDAVAALWPRLAAATTPDTAYIALVAGDHTVWDRALSTTTSAAAVEATAAAPAPVTAAAPAAAPVQAAPAQAAPVQAAPAQAALRWLSERVAEAVGVRPEVIDPHAPLTDYGVDSISLMRLSRMLEDDLGRIPLSVLLDSASLRELTDRLLTDRGPQLTAAVAADTAPAAPVPAAAAPTAAPAPATAAAPQAPAPAPAPAAGVDDERTAVLPDRLVGMWAADQGAAPHAPYNISLAWRLPATTDREALRDAVAALVRRHPVLGCRVRPHDGAPAFVPAAPDTAALVTRVVAGDAVGQAVRDEADRRLDTSAGPLLRAVLWEPQDGGGQGPVLQLTTHHIAVDGRSAELLRDDLAALYAAAAHGGPAPAPAVPFARALRRELEAGPTDAQEDERYWTQRLAGGAAKGVLFPGGGERAGAAGAHREYRMPPALSQSLAQVAQSAGVPPFTALLAAFAAALSRTTGHRSFLVAVPTYGRTSREEETSVGCFVSTVPLRIDLDPGRPVADWLKDLNQEVRGALGHARLPYPRLVELCRAAGGEDAVPTVTLAYQNWERTGGARTPDGWEPVYRRGQRGHFDLGLEVTDTPAGTEILANHRTAVLDAAQVDAFVEDLRRTAAELARRPATVGELLDPAAGTLVGRFAATVARCAQATAVEDAHGSLSYAELDALSDDIARRVSELAEPGAPVAVLMHRSMRLPAVLLGILKSGRPYVPLDDSYPSERLKLVVGDAGCEVAVADRELTWLLPQRLRIVDPTAPTAALVGAGAPAGQGRARAAAVCAPDDLAYVMFTSGSTGRPKGVPVTHANVVHTLEAIARTVGITQDAPGRLLAVTTLCFDISVLELFLPLLAGGTVVIAERADVIDARRLGRLLEQRAVTAMQATPAGWQLLVDGGWSGRRELTALCGGEALPPNLAAALAERTGSLWNVYGPTEATIWSTIGPVTAGGPVHLGEPVGATDLLVTDTAVTREAAVGESGELWIGGPGVARGYWQRPQLTAERFTGHPLRPEGGGRWFRTGDLVRRDDKGRLTFLGRADSQVKVRGHRMELGEIETVLGGHPALARVVVTVHGEGPSARLLAIAVPRAGTALPDIGALREYASAALPPWMLPDRLVAAEQLPLTPNRKVDRQAAARLADTTTPPPAPEPEPAPTPAPADAAPLTAPVTASAPADATPAPAAAPAPVGRAEIADRVGALWRELLELDDVPGDRRFFDLGGNSLLLGRLFARLDDAYPGAALELADLFARPTLDDLVGLLTARLGGDTGPAPADRPGTAPVPARPSRRELRRAFRLGDER